jgi:crotonyl-CoA carboxylase/reductase
MSVRELYELGEIPELGVVPPKMHAWVIRKYRHGPPLESFRREVVDVPEISADEVLVLVMASGVNYNGVWAALGDPLSPCDVHGRDYHISGSDASGVVWKVGSAVRRWKVGDEVVIHCNHTCGQCHNCNGGDPMLCRQQMIWGYETADGAFGQFTRVQAQQLVPKPKNLTWEQAGCYMLVLATAFRMLYGHPPHTLQPAMNVLVWGGAGGLGSMAIQLIKAAGANAIAVVSSEERGKWCLDIGAKAYINRTQFDCWGPLPSTREREAYKQYLRRVQQFGKAIWEITGKNVDPDIVFEHPGEQTFPVSCYICRRGGMVVFCAGTSGFNLTFDAAYVWMRQKRIQGSHFATLMQADAANHSVMDGRVLPCMSQVFDFDRIPDAHDLMWRNAHPPGNMALMVNAPEQGLHNLEETRALAVSPSKG